MNSFHYRFVSRCEQVVVHFGDSYPADVVVVVQSHTSAKKDGADGDKVNGFCSVVVDGFGKDVAGFDVDVHFFLHFPRCAFCSSLARFDPAAGKFPVTAKRNFRLPARNEDSPFAVFDYGGRNIYHASSIRAFAEDCQNEDCRLFLTV